MARIDLSTYLADDTLDLDGIPSEQHPEGKSYQIPSLSSADGLLLQVAAEGTSMDGRMSADGIEAMEKFCRDPAGELVSLQRKLFGSALDEMVADGVSNNVLQKTMEVVMAQANLGTEAARQFVERSAAGEALARANRATRRAAAKKTSSPRKAGSKSAPASGAKSTRRTPASSRGRATSASTTPKAKTA